MQSLQTASRGGNGHATKKVNNSVAKPTSKKAGQPATGGGNGRDETIRLTAYSFYEARGRVDGHDLEDWLQAQAQVNQAAAGAAQPVASG